MCSNSISLYSLIILSLSLFLLINWNEVLALCPVVSHCCVWFRSVWYALQSFRESFQTSANKSAAFIISFRRGSVYCESRGPYGEVSNGPGLWQSHTASLKQLVSWLTPRSLILHHVKKIKASKQRVERVFFNILNAQVCRATVNVFESLHPA